MSSPAEIQIQVNGESRSVPAGLSLQSLLELLGIDTERVAVEMNRAIVRKNLWQETTVPADAALEIVEFVGGGGSDALDEASGVIRLSLRDQQLLAEALLEPAVANPALQRAFEARRQLFGDDSSRSSALLPEPLR